ncbi:MAG: NADP-dependent malic enzyme [Deltaproteobacteria bacterium]|nr:NADP-dependent malic enzyme [Deltaproteobacteria bacterium]MBI3066336.1 NADP-dependent malic enzyme [Deltaproteobacteria bacterium]
MKPNVAELLAKAQKPNEDAMRLHPLYRGKLEVTPKCSIRSCGDFSIWYTPGVAAPCRDIAQHPERVFDHTNKANFVAVISDGTRVLGLGDIGPHAALPVMEGKAILFKYLGGVDAFPICLATKDAEQIIQACKWLEPSFGGINLEDIAKPKCFYILDRLRREMTIPVWHDDQQGTAAVTLAGLINSLKIVGKSKQSARIALIGVGAANFAVQRVLIAAGFPPTNLIMVDSRGILHRGREDLRAPENEFKWEICQRTNPENRTGAIAEALRGADVCIALAKSGPGVIKPEWVEAMAKDAIVFACANPVPEIWPWEVKEAGARIVATGRSDFPNQVNNSLGFPAIFRGVIDVAATTITDEMCIAAAEELARCADSKGLSEERILPAMEEWEVFPQEAAAVGLKAIEQGVARKVRSKNQLIDEASKIIGRAQRQTKTLMEHGVIAAAD